MSLRQLDAHLKCLGEISCAAAAGDHQENDIYCSVSSCKTRARCWRTGACRNAYWFACTHASKTPNEGTDRTLDFCQNAGIMTLHCDDMSALTYPDMNLKTGSDLQRHTVAVNGQYDMQKDRLFLLMSEGGANKDSSAVFEEVLQVMLLHLNGQQGLHLVFDRGPLNYSGLISGALLMFLCDLGIIKWGVIQFLWYRER